jgi:FtsP/CotA-like multicopper oxidase with cupredoxin domain
MRFRPVLVLLVPLAGALGAACSSSGPSPIAASKSDSAPKSTTTTTAQVISSSTVTINGQPVKVPTEDGTDPIKPFGDTGQQVILSSSGVLPRSLYASLNEPVTWTNLTDHPVRLTLQHVPGVSPQTIQPGTSYSWNPVNQLSFSYSSSSGGTGFVYSGVFGN